MVSAVLFDLDGTLIDARDWHFNALNTALGVFGYEIPLDQHLQEFDGLPTAVKLNKLSEKTNLPYSLHPIISELKQREVLKQISMNCRPSFPHVVMLKKLKSDSYKLGVVTNSISKTTNLMLKLAGLKDYFDVVVTNEDVTLPKPDAAPYLLACERLGKKPQEVLVLEDNLYGLQSATGAGCHVKRILTPSELDYALVYTELSRL
jgi:HAD superfamily hydrolase (TIGR01509 family)